MKMAVTVVERREFFAEMASSLAPEKKSIGRGVSIKVGGQEGTTRFEALLTTFDPRESDKYQMGEEVDIIVEPTVGGEVVALEQDSMRDRN